MIEPIVGFYYLSRKGDGIHYEHVHRVIVRRSQEKKEDTETEGAGTGEKKHPGAEKNVEKKEGA